jgi:hypothetical protein
MLSTTVNKQWNGLREYQSRGNTSIDFCEQKGRSQGSWTTEFVILSLKIVVGYTDGGVVTYM